MAALDGVVVGFYEGGGFTTEGRHLDASLGGALTKQWTLTAKKGKPGDVATFLDLSAQYPRIAVVGLGKNDSDPSTKRLGAGVGVKALQEIGATSIGVDTSFGNLQATAEGAYLSLYVYRNKKVGPSPAVHPFPDPNEKPEWVEGRVVANYNNWARDLAESPSNLMSPELFVTEVQKVFSDKVGRGYDITVNIHKTNWIREQKMGLFESVAQGSGVDNARFLEIKFKKSVVSEIRPLIFVGKGITFDSGGISLKPGAGMADMKADMTGAAAVVAAARAILELGAHPHVIVLTPLTDNMPAGNSTKPGDVHTAKNGKTVEIDNTDAEGRLVLADALVYACEQNPHTIVDVATLTGAIDTALGFVTAGAFTPSDELWEQLAEASKKSSEKMWRMPLYAEYLKQMESRVADLINVSPTKSAGACTAAVFLKEFVTIDRWLHLDIAGIMSNNQAPSAIESKGMSGKPVRTLVELAKVIASNVKPTQRVRATLHGHSLGAFGSGGCHGR